MELQIVAQYPKGASKCIDNGPGTREPPAVVFKNGRFLPKKTIMEQKQMDLTRKEALQLLEALQGIRAALEKQNALIESCILKPNDQPARLMAGTYGAIEVINL